MALTGERIKQAVLSLLIEELAQGRPVRFHVTGHSMEPTLHAGDAVLIEPVAADQLAEGDVVVFQAGPGLIVHRIRTRLEADGAVAFVTQGDNRSHPDFAASPLPAARILGRVVDIVRHVPKPDKA